MKVQNKNFSNGYLSDDRFICLLIYLWIYLFFTLELITFGIPYFPLE